MAAALIERDGQRILVADATGPLISRVQDALALMSQAWEHKASMIGAPVARFDPEFFRLRSGLAGEITQKFVNYRAKLAVIGGISEKAAESVALRDFVCECNDGNAIFFSCPTSTPSPPSSPPSDRYVLSSPCEGRESRPSVP